MKGWFKLLVLATIPILAATAVVDQGLAADKGSQLIFQSNMAHTSYISVVNAQPGSTDAVTVLVQYYNNEMEMVIWYLRVIPHGTNVLVDPFDHMRFRARGIRKTTSRTRTSVTPSWRAEKPVTAIS